MSETQRDHRPRVVLVDEHNDPKEILDLEVEARRPPLPEEVVNEVLTA